jgi:NADPH:quinone reductase-like Zn-dependent oxidoreductase
LKAIVLRELGAPENLKLEELPDPAPSQGEVVVKLKGAALNHRDVWIRLGQYAGIKLPIVPGSDGAGEVITADDKSLIGQAVVINPSLNWGNDARVQGPAFKILGLPDDGTYAEMVRVPAANVVPKPEALSFEEASALPLAGLTAYRAVVSRAGVKSGETVLVTGIGGGVSSLALQIAKHLGASVLVTSGSDEKLARAKGLGADGGVNYHSPDWGKEILGLTEGKGPDVVIDSVGGETFGKAIEIVKPGGRIVTYGATTGALNKLEVRRIFWKQVNICGSTMGTPQEFASLIELFGKSGLRPAIDQVFPLREAAAAHRRMEEAGQFGKIVLRIE